MAQPRNQSNDDKIAQKLKKLLPLRKEGEIKTKSHYYD